MMDERISQFIKKHHLLTLATTQDNHPYCASCFYAYDDVQALLILATDPITKHAKEALQNPSVAGTIALETKLIGKIQGVQFTGRFRQADEKEVRRYLKRFPYAIAVHPHVWCVEIEYLKFTDNTLGFGKKLEFFRSPTPS